MSPFTDAIRRGDAFRRCPATHADGARHTEWSHFCVFGDGLCVIVNLSLGDGASAGRLVPRVAAMVFVDGAWHGEVDTLRLADVDVAAGRIDAVFGPSSLRFVHGVYELKVASVRAPVSLELALTPRAAPLVTTNAWLYPGALFNWVSVPRLVATGVVCVGDRTISLRDAPAYHDHNWGSCAFAGDFSWEWGALLPHDADAPWAAMFVRLTDGARAKVFASSIMLWKHALPWRSFRHREARFTAEGRNRVPHVHTLPAELRSLVPGTSHPVPGILRLRGDGDGDRLEGELIAGPPARMVIPGEPPRLTVVHESPATGRLSGSVRGEAVALDGVGILEVVDGACLS